MCTNGGFVLPKSIGFFFMEHEVFDNNGNLFKRRCIKYEEVVKARQKVYRFLVMLQVLRRKENSSNKVVLFFLKKNALRLPLMLSLLKRSAR